MQNSTTPVDTEAVVTAERLGEILSVGTSTIWKYVRADRIPSVTIGKARRFIVSDVLAALRESS